MCADIAVSWIFEAKIKANTGVLRVYKAWQSRPTEIERYRENTYRPNADYSFLVPSDRNGAAAGLADLQMEMEAHEADEKSRALEAERERVFKLWYAFLRAKADLEARRENAIHFINRRVDGTTIVFVTELPATLDLIGQSRIVRLPSGQHVFCDVIDVNLEEVIATVTSGDASRLAKQGLLELNTIAAEKAIDRQRWALDAVNYNRTPNRD